MITNKLQKGETIGKYFQRIVEKSNRLEEIWLSNVSQEIIKYTDKQLAKLKTIILKEEERRERDADY